MSLKAPALPSITPKHTLLAAVALMFIVMAGICTIAVVTLARNHSDLSSVSRSVQISDSYWAVLNSSLRANLEAAQIESGNSPEAGTRFKATLISAFEAVDAIKATGTDADRQILADFEQMYAESLQVVLAYLMNPGEGGVPQLPAEEVGTILADVTNALSEPAGERRREALTDLERLENANATRSIVILAAIGLGLPAILAIVREISRYERKNLLQEAQLRALREAALTDSLTGLGNHRSYQEELRRQWTNSALQERAFTLAVMDIDDFKVINDSKGHAHGDQVLRGLGRLLSASTNSARTFRLGGDEFALLLPEGDTLTAAKELSHILGLIVATLGCDVSIGLCCNQQVDDLEELRNKADIALYEAKRRGKAQVIVYSEELDEDLKGVIRKRKALQDVLGVANIGR